MALFWPRMSRSGSAPQVAMRKEDDGEQQQQQHHVVDMDLAHTCMHIVYVHYHTYKLTQHVLCISFLKDQ